MSETLLDNVTQISKPMIIPIPDGWEVAYLEGIEEGITFHIKNLSKDRDNCTRANLTVFGLRLDMSLPLANIRINLNSLSSRHSLAKEIGTHFYEITFMPWYELVNDAIQRALALYSQGEPAQEIWPSKDANLSPEYLIEPIIYLNQPTVIFGDYGSCKSLIALGIAYLAQLPFYDNGLGLRTRKESSPCLFLDYEDDQEDFKMRWSALEQGFQAGDMPICYCRMISPLADSVEQVRKIIHEKDIKLVIVDSLGPAARGNLNDPEPAIKYHAALRQLNTTSLTLAHNAKDPVTTKRTIFGSVFFTNLARSVWECKSEQEIGEAEAVISLKHTKANLSKLHLALGFRLAFEDNAIKITRADLKDTSLAGELPLSILIKASLQHGAMAVKELAEERGKGDETIRKTLRRMEAKSQVTQLPDKTWGLAV